MSFVSQWPRRAWLVLAVAAVIIGLDQWTKELVRAQIAPYTYTIPIPALGEYFVFEHVYNTGAAFGLLQNMGPLLIAIALIVSGAILVYVGTLPTQQWGLRLLLGLQMGGAIGNVIDRLNQGYVTDFVKVGIPDLYYWPNFNIADSAIVVGVILLGIYVIRDDMQRQREQRPEANSARAVPSTSTQGDG